jgi:hypothetical protein
MGRVARAVVAGCPHHVTQRGNRRGDVFEVDEDRGAYLLFLQRAEALPWSSSPAAQTRTYVTARPVEGSVERMKIRKFVVCPRISRISGRRGEEGGHSPPLCLCDFVADR